MHFKFDSVKVSIFRFIVKNGMFETTGRRFETFSKICLISEFFPHFAICSDPLVGGGTIYSNGFFLFSQF